MTVKREKRLSKKISDEEIVAALHENKGNLVNTAETLNCGYQTLYWRVSQNAELAKAKKKAQEVVPTFIADLAEDALAKKIKDGCTTSIIFALKTIGKYRGYAQEDIRHADSVTIIHQLASEKPKEIDGDHTTISA